MISKNEAPYFDDFNTALEGEKSPADKNYIRLLFRPGRAVQVREMNSLQSAIAKQIERFGDSLFESGTRVIDGIPRFRRNVDYLEIDANSLSEVVLDNLESLRRFYVQPPIGSITLTNILRGDILKAELIDGIVRIFFYYSQSFFSTTNPATTAVISNNLFLFDDTSIVDQLGVAQSIPSGTPLGAVTRIGKAFGLDVEEGVYYYNGAFLKTDRQTFFIVSEDANRNPISSISGEIHFRVKVRTVDFVEDEQLLDNALGTPNFSSPGADRLAVDLELVFITNASNFFYEQSESVLSLAAAENIESFLLTQVSNGRAILTPDIRFRSINDEISRRTFETNGNFSLTPFKISTRELIRENRNSGRFLENELVNVEGGLTAEEARDKYLLTIDPSTAYVNGKRIELQDKLEIVADKARDIVEDVEVSFSARMGQFVLANGITGGIPNLTTQVTPFEIRNGTTVLGTCRIRGINMLTTTSYNIFVYDIQQDAEQANIATADNILSGSIEISLTSGFNSIGNADRSAIYNLPNESVESISELAYTRYAYYSSITFSDEEATISPTPSSLIGVGARGIAFGNGSVVALTVLFDSNTDTITLVAPASLGDTAAATVLIEERHNITSFATATDTTGSINHDFSTNEFTIEADGDVLGIDTVINATDSNADVESLFIIVEKRTIEESVTTRVNQRSRLTLRYIGNTEDVEIGDSLVFTFTKVSASANGPFTTNTYTALDLSLRPSSDVLDFRLNAAVSQNVIVPNTIIDVQYDYYLPRVDVIAVSDSGDFRIIRGISSTTPLAPRVPSNSMALYELKLYSYTNNVTSDIIKTYIDNKRFRMRDIGRLEDRIKKLEYYTSLSLLEKETEGTRIFDPESGNERFNNGFIVDSFFGHNVGNILSKEYFCSIDRKRGELRPYFYTQNWPFRYNSALEKGQVILTAPRLADVTIIEQLRASKTISIVPLEVAVFTGILSLSPEADEWQETDRRPDLIVQDDSVFDAFQEFANANNILGTDWGNWEASWRGETINSVQQFVAPGREQEGWPWIRRTSTTSTIAQQREGVATTLGSENIETDTGDRIVDISFIPFIRSRKIYFSAQNLRPNTKLFAFFDDIDITPYCRQLAEAKTFNDDTDTETFRNEFFDFVSEGEELIVDSNGFIHGEFFIPQNSELAFRTGERVFKLTSSPRNDDVESITLASTRYFASGVRESRERTIISTRQPILNRERITESTVVTQTTNSDFWFDPIAQTFIQSESDTGIMLSSVDLWFSQKHGSLPVTVRVVECENGIPTQKVLPLGSITLYPDDVNLAGTLSPELSQHTRFKFPNPLYLAPGIEYAFIVYSDSDLYRVWYSTLGENDARTGEFIADNPYAGVMLKSANASTWTPMQESDIMFRLSRAVFEVNNSAEYEFDLKHTDAEVNLSKVDRDPRLVGDPLIPHTFVNLSKITNFNTTSSQWSVISPENTSVFELPEENDLRVIQVPNGSSFELNNGDNLKLKANLSSDDGFLSPLLDIENVSILTIENSINGDEQDEETPNGESYSRYIMRTVRLNNPADQLNIFINGNRPNAGTDIAVYVKVRAVSDDPNDSFDDDLLWRKVEAEFPINPRESIASETELEFSSSTVDSFVFTTSGSGSGNYVFNSGVWSNEDNADFAFEPTGPDEAWELFNSGNPILTADNVTDNPWESNWPSGGISFTLNEIKKEFTEFAIKILLLSSNRRFTPVLQDVRAIATS